jgi:glycine reductase
MDAENQSTIMRLADEYGKDKLMVFLGASDVEGVEISAETLIIGDPSFAGPLAGVQLGLQVYHILEPSLKQYIPEDVYQDKLGIFEVIVDAQRIEDALSKLREQAAGG